MVRGGLSVPVAPQEVPKATETTSQSERLAPPQLLPACFQTSRFTKGQYQARANLVLSASQTAQMAEIKPST